MTVDVERLLTHPDEFQRSGNDENDRKVLDAVITAVEADLTPERYEAAWRFLDTYVGRGVPCPVWHAGLKRLAWYVSGENKDKVMFIGALRGKEITAWLGRILDLFLPIKAILDAHRRHT